MIQEITLKNFKSFRDEVTLSFEATGDDRYNSQIEMPDGVKLLRFAVVLGANASGKSNLLEALEFLRRFWHTIPNANDQGTEVEPFLLMPDALSKDSTFEVKIYIDGVKYWYKLAINPAKVMSEELLVYLSNRPTRVFQRVDDNGISRISFNPSLVKISQAEQEVLTMNCLCNMSLLSSLKKVNIKIPYLVNIRRWVDTAFMPMQKGGGAEISPEAKEMLERDDAFREYIVKFAQNADFNISDIKIKKLAALFAHTVHTEEGEEQYVLPERCQSAGTTRMVQLESLIYQLLKCQGFLCIDEVESSMHPRLLEFILTQFVNERDNQSQLLVTTHYDPLLNDIDDIFGKDSVWFTEKESDGASQLYSLTEFRGLNKLSSIHKAYLNGQFGAVPNVMM
ncbi:MAG: ATP-binding protein [Bacteroidales bacterium]|nr:ATP-binding protein [Bacteroidales bacterium]